MNSSEFICRSCASPNSSEYIELEIKFDESTLLERFNYCTRLQASSDDNLPHYICITCCELLKTVYDFINLACKTDNMFRTRLAAFPNEHDVDFQEVEKFSPDIKTEMTPEYIILSEEEEIIAEDVQFLEEEEDDDFHEHDFNCEFISTTTSPQHDNQIEYPEGNIAVHEGISKEIYTCGFCSQTFECLNDLAQHQTSLHEDDHSKDTAFEEEVSDKIKVEQYDKIKHSTEKKPVQCPYCKEEFKNIIAHIKAIHSNILPPPPDGKRNISLAICPYCYRNCRTIGMLNDHINTHTGESPYSCDFCQKTFHQKRILDVHKSKCKEAYPLTNQKQTKSDQQELKCDICNFTTKSESSMIGHKYRHKRPSEPKYLCSSCPRKFHNPKALDQHEDYKHGNQEKALQCDLCEKKFPNSRKLKEHISNVHTNGRPFKCEECPKSFKNNFQLKAHMKLHTSKDISCPECDKKFVRQTDLKVHMRSHTGELPYECHLCDKRYAIKVRLTYHLQKHLGIKHKCQHCSEEFNNRSKFRLHMFKHIGMPYVCDHCPMGFPKRISLARHSKRQHKIILTEEELSANRIRNEQNVNRGLVSKSLLISSDKNCTETEINYDI